MAPNEYCVEGGSPKKSEMFSTIDRIDKKIESLKSVLRPIIQEVPQEVPQSNSGTELSIRLHQVENEITYLLDSIQL